MSKVITMQTLLDRLNGFLHGGDYDDFRSYVYSRYEAEEEIVVEDDADEVLSVLAPYVETEEAFPDINPEVRLRRTAKLLENANGVSITALCVFGLNYDEIADLTAKVDSAIIPQNVYVAQLRRLTPAEFDVGLVSSWAKKQKGDKEPDLTKLA